MATTYEPVGRNEYGHPIFESVCEVCGRRCWTWASPTIEVPSREVLEDKVGAPAYCDDHATPPMPPPEPVPEFITPAQLRIAARRMLGIDRARLEGTVAQIIASVPDDQARQDAQDKWDLASVIERTHPLVAVVGQVFGLTEDQVDQLFRVGATL